MPVPVGRHGRFPLIADGVPEPPLRGESRDRHSRLGYGEQYQQNGKPVRSLESAGLRTHELLPTGMTLTGLYRESRAASIALSDRE